MAKKRKRRKGSLKNLKQMISPTKQFEFENPNDPEDFLVFTARRLSPGHLLQFSNTTLIRAYKESQLLEAQRKKKLEEKSKENVEVEETQSKEEVLFVLEVETLEKILSEFEHSAEIASMSLIDPNTEETILTKEECLSYLLPQWTQEVALWALKGSGPQKEGGEANDIDMFPSKTGKQESEKPTGSEELETPTE